MLNLPRRARLRRLWQKFSEFFFQFALLGLDCLSKLCYTVIVAEENSGRQVNKEKGDFTNYETGQILFYLEKFH